MNGIDTPKDSGREINENLKKNLRVLLQLSGSIAAASRELNINRQQLNKYLNGSSVPSLKTAKKICDYYKIDESELFWDHTEFLNLFRSPTTKAAQQKTLVDQVSSIILQYCGEAESLFDLSGKYYLYTVDPRDPSRLFRTFIKVFYRDGFLLGKSIEYERGSDRNGNSSFLHTLDSVVMRAGERIYFIDYESSGRPNANFGMMIFYPTYVRKHNVYIGHLLSVSNFGNRKIYSSPVCLEKVGEKKIMPSEIRECGSFEFDQEKLPEEMVKHLLS